MGWCHAVLQDMGEQLEQVYQLDISAVLQKMVRIKEYTYLVTTGVFTKVLNNKHSNFRYVRKLLES